MRKFTFLTDCVGTTALLGDAAGDAINAMTATAKGITRRTFLKHVDRAQLRELEHNLGYFRHPKQGLTMAADWHPGYYKGVFDGKPCYYFDHSRIEHIFTAQ